MKTNGLRGYKATGDICHFDSEDNYKRKVKYFCKYSKGKISCAKCRNIIKDGN